MTWCRKQDAIRDHGATLKSRASCDLNSPFFFCVSLFHAFFPSFLPSFLSFLPLYDPFLPALSSSSTLSLFFFPTLPYVPWTFPTTLSPLFLLSLPYLFYGLSILLLLHQSHPYSRPISSYFLLPLSPLAYPTPLFLSSPLHHFHHLHSSFSLYLAPPHLTLPYLSSSPYHTLPYFTLRSRT